MALAQLFETTLVNDDSDLSARFLTVPTGFRPVHLPEDPSEVATLIGGTYLETISPDRLPEALAWALTPAAEVTAAVLAREGDRFLNPSLLRFSNEVLDQLLLPFEGSPLQLYTLRNILSRPGWQMGAGAALIGFWGSPLLLLVVPAGMVLGGAAEGVGKALNRGLRKRIERRLLGKRR